MRKILFVLMCVVAAVMYTYNETELGYTFREFRIRKEAYDYARDCSGLRDGLTFWQTKIQVTQGDRILVHDNDDAFFAVALFVPEDSTIYIPEAHRLNPQILAHEYLHTFGVVGHDSRLFKHCFVDTSQM